ncbi:dienelactone hydrolase family protein [Vulcaniibacterium gelatinicum]|uniref:dienelactone hydrolase family protein n=1 Tax=Vulcaniibacterium gelatinicum TaxID=2598725 RepID=UPI0011C984B0|nr:dienelactone hydrolase family protein [Vulcaniibacterium gelatinicum]
MGEWIPSLTTALGPVRAWRARPERPSRGGVIVVQEIFGVNPHIRAVAERFAEAGFTALAPAMFDVLRPDVELRYDDGGIIRGRELVSELGFDGALSIVSAAAHWLREAGHNVGVVGFCWGGTVAFLSCTRLSLPAVDYYGARSVPFLGEPARAPLMCHFGELDASIPPADVTLHRQKQPQARIFVYPGADHAFNRDVDPRVYHPQAAALAWQRTVDFLAEHLR